MIGSGWRRVSGDGTRFRSIESPPDLLRVFSTNHISHSLAEDVQEPLNIKIICCLQ